MVPSVAPVAAYNFGDARLRRPPSPVISTRLGAALALLLSVAAVALGTAALFLALRDDAPERGRLVQTHLIPSGDDPVLFSVDEFYAGTGSDGAVHALYVYPPGFFGHDRGCKVVWSPGLTAFGSTSGEFIDPCGGARFNRDGALVSGPADRGLDEFKTEPGIEGVIVDTRTLYCGAPKVEPAATPADTPTAASERAECKRVSADGE